MFYLTFILSIPLAALVLLVIYYYWSRRHLYNAASKIKGPSGFPLIGNAHVFVGKNEGKEHITQKNCIKTSFKRYLIKVT